MTNLPNTDEMRALGLNLALDNENPQTWEWAVMHLNSDGTSSWNSEMSDLILTRDSYDFSPGGWFKSRLALRRVNADGSEDRVIVDGRNHNRNLVQHCIQCIAAEWRDIECYKALVTWETIPAKHSRPPIGSETTPQALDVGDFYLGETGEVYQVYAVYSDGTIQIRAADGGYYNLSDSGKTMRVTRISGWDNTEVPIGKRGHPKDMPVWAWLELGALGRDPVQIESRHHNVTHARKIDGSLVRFHHEYKIERLRIPPPSAAPEVGETDNGYEKCPACEMRGAVINDEGTQWQCGSAWCGAVGAVEDGELLDSGGWGNYSGIVDIKTSAPNRAPVSTSTSIDPYTGKPRTPGSFERYKKNLQPYRMSWSQVEARKAQARAELDRPVTPPRYPAVHYSPGWEE